MLEGTLLPGGCREEELAHAAHAVAQLARLRGEAQPASDVLRAVSDAAGYACAMDVTHTILSLMIVMIVTEAATDIGDEVVLKNPSWAEGLVLTTLALVPSSAGLVRLRPPREQRLLALVQGISADHVAASPFLQDVVREAHGGGNQRLIALVAARLEQCPAAAATGAGPLFVAPRDPRLCALPSCASAEAGDAVFRVCPRCAGRAAYCCAEHQQADWKVHKKGCKPPAAAAAASG